LYVPKLSTRWFAALALLAAAGGPARAQTTPFLPGDLAVLRLGDGSATLSATSAPVFIDEYTPAGALVRSIAVDPSVFSSAGSATSEGQLNRSSDGRFLIFAGYNAPAGTAAIAATAATAVQRSVARVDGAGTVSFNLLGSSAYSTGNPRGAASTNGTDVWVGGTGGAGVAGVQYTSFGSGTATQITAAPNNTRYVNIANGQLYLSSASSPFFGVAAVGTGTPTASGQTAVQLPGFPTATGPSNYDFVFANPNTLYVADDRTTAGGGVEKWTFDGSTWTMQYSTLAGTAGLRSLTLSGTTLYGITTDNRLVSAVDTGPAATGFTFTTLATAGTNTVFRGVDFVPVPEPGHILLACGATAGLTGWWARRRKSAPA
jgi:hypothetical protein